MSLSTLLDAVERTLSSALETGPLRFFRARLEPVHIVRHLERELDRHALTTAGGVVVPREMLVRIHPSDEARLRTVGPGVAADIGARLLRSVHAQGRTVLGPMVVRIEPDPGVPRGRVRTEVADAIEGEVQEVAPLPPTSKLPVASNPKRSLQIRLSDGETLTFDQPVVSIGRGVDNDVVISDPQISRSHAEIRAQGNQLVLMDLQSTNGTWLNDSRIDTATLLCPARVRVGSAEIHVDWLRA